MSFDEQPDGDPHGECAIEIARLEAEVDRLNTRILNTVHMIDAGSTKGQIRLNLTAALDDGKRHHAYKYGETFCSQCGGEFGPGNEGFSHCENHKHLPRLG